MIGIRKRVGLLLAGLAVSYLFAMVVWHETSESQVCLVRSVNQANTRRHLTRLVYLNSASLDTLVREFSARAQLVDFIAHPDEPWARENPDAALIRFKADGVWVFDSGGHCIHSGARSRNPTVKGPPIGEQRLAASLVDRPASHFFVQFRGGLLEVRGVRIYSQAASAHTRTVRGYLFAGKLWNRPYLEELSRLTDYEATLRLIGENGAREGTKPDGTTMDLQLPGADGRPVAFARFRDPRQPDRILWEMGLRSMAIFLLFVIVVLGILSCCLWRWITIPLDRIDAVLRTGDKELLADLPHDKAEFGQLARLISEFYSQKAALLNEVKERRRAEQTARAGEARFRAAIEGCLDAFFLMNAVRNHAGEIEDYVVTVVNANAALLLGRPRETLLNKRISEILPHAHADGYFTRYAQVISSRLPLEEEFALLGHTIKAEWLHHQIVPVGDGVAVTTRDVSDRKWMEDQIREQIAQVNDNNCRMEKQAQLVMQANARLEALATQDGLTGLKNHRAFQEHLAIEFSRGVRYGHPTSVIMADVDLFKQYNDAFGHPAGDQVLKDLAGVFGRQTRATDFVARYGGEEFAILLPETDARAALQVAERIRKAIAHHAWEKRTITISMGISTLSGSTLNGAMLLEEADQALYIAKSNGRDSCTHYTVYQQLAA